MKFKQYFHGGLDDFFITSAKTNSIGFILEDLLDGGTTIDVLRPTKITFEEDENIGVDPDDLLTFMSGDTLEEDLKEENYAYVRRYVEALGGIFPKRIPAVINFQKRKDRHFLYFDTIVFNEDGKYETFVITAVTNLPKNVKIIVKMEPLDEPYDGYEDVDTYIIRNLAEPGEDMRFAIEEYRESKLLKIIELGEDEKGNFELIAIP